MDKLIQCATVPILETKNTEDAVNRTKLDVHREHMCEKSSECRVVLHDNKWRSHDSLRHFLT